MNSDQSMHSPAVEVATAPKTEEVNSISAKTRNRLSASDKKAKREAVAADYREGHPKLAIMLRQSLNKSQLNEIILDLLSEGEIIPVAPSYEVVAVSKPIKALPQFADGSVEYVRVEQAEQGITLTPYIKENDDAHNQ